MRLNSKNAIEMGLKWEAHQLFEKGGGRKITLSRPI